MQTYDLHHPDIPIPHYSNMSEPLKVTDFCNTDNLTFFVSYRKGTFMYRVNHIKTGQCYTFPVPEEDLGDATLNACEKAITLMRYIRTAIQSEPCEIVPYTVETKI